MKRSRSTALPFLLAAALALLAAPAAHAEDAFYLESDTGMKFTGEYMDATEAGCWFGPTGNMISGNAAEDGSIRSNIGPFDECTDSWGADFVYSLDGAATGSFTWAAYDWALMSSTLDCEADGPESAAANGFVPIERFMSAEVDGTTCTIEWLPGMGPSRSGRALLAATGWHSRMVDSLARVSGGKAKVSVQVFGAGERPVRDALTLRTRSGRVIGRGVGSTRAGASATSIAVPLAPFARERLAEKRELVVSALLEHADGTPGSGDRTRQLVVRRG